MGNDSSRPSSPAPPTEEPDGDPTQPASVRVDVDADLVGLVCKTSEFDSDTYLVTRRGVQISISLFSTVKLRVSSVVLSDYPSASKTVSLAHVEDSSRSSGSAVEVRIDIPVNCPVGEYELRVSGDHGARPGLQEDTPAEGRGALQRLVCSRCGLYGERRAARRVRAQLEGSSVRGKSVRDSVASGALQ